MLDFVFKTKGICKKWSVSVGLSLEDHMYHCITNGLEKYIFVNNNKVSRVIELQYCMSNCVT